MKNIIIIILAILGLGGYLWYSQNSATPSVAQKPATTVPPGFTPPTTPPPTDQTADSSRGEALRDWKTYTNEKYGFSFKYPTDFVKDSETTTKISFKRTLAPFTTLNVFTNPQVGFEGYDAYKPSVTVAIAGLPSEISFAKDTGQQLFIFSGVSRGNNYFKIYSFSNNTASYTEDLFSTFLSTFRFTK